MIAAALVLFSLAPPLQSRPAGPVLEVPFPAAAPFSAMADLPRPPKGSIRVLVARHAESVGNATGDDPKLTAAQKDRLTEKGLRQAEALGKVLQGAGVGRLLHSPAGRARETAEAVQKAFPPSAAVALAASPEMGPLVVGTSPDPKVPPMKLLASRWSRGEDPRLEGGETLAELAHRVRLGIAGLPKAAGGAATVAVVTHGEVLLACLSGFQPALLPTRLTSISTANTSIGAFDVAADGTATCLGLYVPPAAESRPMTR